MYLLSAHCISGLQGMQGTRHDIPPFLGLTFWLEEADNERKYDFGKCY